MANSPTLSGWSADQLGFDPQMAPAGAELQGRNIFSLAGEGLNQLGDIAFQAMPQMADPAIAGARSLIRGTPYQGERQAISDYRAAQGPSQVQDPAYTKQPFAIGENPEQGRDFQEKMTNLVAAMATGGGGGGRWRPPQVEGEMLAGFRDPLTGKMHPTGAVHDIGNLPAELQTDEALGRLESGFILPGNPLKDPRVPAWVTREQRNQFQFGPGGASWGTPAAQMPRPAANEPQPGPVQGHEYQWPEGHIPDGVIGEIGPIEGEPGAKGYSFQTHNTYWTPEPKPELPMLPNSPVQPPGDYKPLPWQEEGFTPYGPTPSETRVIGRITPNFGIHDPKNMMEQPKYFPRPGEPKVPEMPESGLPDIPPLPKNASFSPYPYQSPANETMPNWVSDMNKKNASSPVTWETRPWKQAGTFTNNPLDTANFLAMQRGAWEPEAGPVATGSERMAIPSDWTRLGITEKGTRPGEQFYHLTKAGRSPTETLPVLPVPTTPYLSQNAGRFVPPWASTPAEAKAAKPIYVKFYNPKE